MPDPIRLRDDDRDWTVDVSGSTATVTGEPIQVVDAGDGRWRATDAAGDRQAIVALSGDDVWVQIDGELFAFHVTTDTATRATTRGRDALTPPMSATVVRIAITIGDHVAQGDTLIVLEAMKMELPIRAPYDGTVTALHCQTGDLVQPGIVLVDVKSDDER